MNCDHPRRPNHPLETFEIVERVFDYLDEIELIVSCSVSRLWYDVAARTFRRFNNNGRRRLYKWPYGSVPQWASELCVVNLQGLEHVLRTCKGVERLHLTSTRPVVIRRGLLTKVIALCPTLRELCLSNFIFNVKRVEELLSVSFNLRLEIISLEEDGYAIDPLSLRLLLDNRELFSEVFLLNNRTKTANGWYPRPNDRLAFVKTSTLKRVDLDCLGLTNIHLTAQPAVTTLSLKNASNLDDDALNYVARLPLKRFHLTHSKVSENIWLEAFDRGDFAELTSLSVVDSDNLTESVLKRIAARALTDLTVDIRRHASEIESVRVLSRMTTLKRLKLICETTVLKDLVRLFSTNLKKLKSLTVIKYDFTASSNSFTPINHFIDHWKRKNVKIEYKVVMKQKISIQIKSF